jgi:hypothetical protein
MSRRDFVFLREARADTKKYEQLLQELLEEKTQNGI